MKIIRGFCGIVSIIALIVCLFLPVAAADISVSSGCHSVDAAMPLSESNKLLDTSKAVILYERNSDTMVYAWNPDEKIYPSSMVKLMTALVALEHGALTDTVTVTKSAINTLVPGSLCLKPVLQSGETLTLEALLYAMMTASANDASVVIAEHIAGSQEAFVQLMNDKAAQLGCLATNYSNVHGLHDELTYTTARDLCRLLDIALENEMFKTLFTAKEYTIPATNKSAERNIITSNHMMSKAETSKFFDERVTGGKTGSTNAAGRCLAVTAESNGMELLGIVMGAVPTYAEEGVILATHGNFEEMKVLLDYGCNGFAYRQIFYDNQVIAQYPVAGGENDVVTRPVAQLSSVLPVEYDESLLSWTYEDSQSITAPVKAGQHISNVQVWYGNICLAQTELVAMTDVDAYQKPTDPTPTVNQEKDSDLSGVLWIVGGIIGIVLVFALVIFIYRSVSAARRRARRQRRNRDRRRNF